MIWTIPDETAQEGLFQIAVVTVETDKLCTAWF